MSGDATLKTALLLGGLAAGGFLLWRTARTGDEQSAVRDALQQAMDALLNPAVSVDSQVSPTPGVMRVPGDDGATCLLRDPPLCGKDAGGGGSSGFLPGDQADARRSGGSIVSSQPDLTKAAAVSLLRTLDQANDAGQNILAFLRARKTTPTLTIPTVETLPVDPDEFQAGATPAPPGLQYQRDARGNIFLVAV